MQYLSNGCITFTTKSGLLSTVLLFLVEKSSYMYVVESHIYSWLVSFVLWQWWFGGGVTVVVWRLWGPGRGGNGGHGAGGRTCTLGGQILSSTVHRAAQWRCEKLLVSLCSWLLVCVSCVWIFSLLLNTLGIELANNRNHHSQPVWIPCSACPV